MRNLKSRIHITIASFLVALSAGCARETVQEQWIGHYENPEYVNAVPIHFTLLIHPRGRIDGLASQGFRQTWVVEGHYENSELMMNLAPLNEELSLISGMTFSGFRKSDTIEGNWLNEEGVERSWSAKLTDLEQEDALPEHEVVCDDQTATHPNVTRMTCN